MKGTAEIRAQGSRGGGHEEGSRGREYDRHWTANTSGCREMMARRYFCLADHPATAAGKSIPVSVSLDSRAPLSPSLPPPPELSFSLGGH